MRARAGRAGARADVTLLAPTGGREFSRRGLFTGAAAAGLLGLAAASDGSRLLLGVGAAGALALGLLLGAGWYVPGIVRVVGALPSVAGPTAKLAAANAVRNPKRTTATCLALMLAVGLVVSVLQGSPLVGVSIPSSLVLGALAVLTE